jgi:hypothetical protein
MELQFRSDSGSHEACMVGIVDTVGSLSLKPRQQFKIILFGMYSGAKGAVI